MFEIRNYHFDPAKFDEYKKWAATLAVPFIKSRMDVVGFWVANDMAPEYGGTAPRDETVRPANVTWIIRWRDKSERDKAWEDISVEPGMASHSGQGSGWSSKLFQDRSKVCHRDLATG